MKARALAAESRIDKSRTKNEALASAIEATELYMKAAKLAATEHERTRLRKKCNQLLHRAEEIKNLSNWEPKTFKKTVLKAPLSNRILTTTEKIILLEGSKLHGFIFPPWDADPLDSLFNSSEIYTENHELELSVAQKEIFAGWKRPAQAFHCAAGANYADDDIKYMVTENECDLVQDITTDCSVIASLCAGIARNSKGHGKLLASIVYPYNEVDARPRLSKTGMYIYRVFFNGCFRKVVIDDRLPTANSTRSLHVFDRNNPTLLWPALLEKAYLKVRGGYDFLGSNSGTDLWILSGWIPEQVFLNSDEFQSQQLWDKFLKSYGFGDVIITLGTGKLSYSEEKELGLAGKHDYAVLDMKEVRDKRLLLVKNPWCDGIVWKGASISLEDSLSEMNMSESTSTKPTQGTFWITFEDVMQHFESLYLNWNPGLFSHRLDHHFTWTLTRSCAASCFVHNPQYSLSSTSAATDSIWIVLSKHFVTTEQAVNKAKSRSHSSEGASELGFISLYVFASSGERIYLSENALHRGAFVDSPQTLARFDVKPSESYTIVVAQQKMPLPKYSFTLSIFSRNPMKVAQARDTLPHYSIHNGFWTTYTAGGNVSSTTYPLNPQYSIKLSETSDLILVLEADQLDLAIHVKLVWGNGQRVTSVAARDVLGSSGDYRRGCALASLSNVSSGSYTIVVSTFEPGQLGKFTLRVSSSTPCSVAPVAAETAGRLSIRLPLLRFDVDCTRVLAPLSIERLVRLRLVARSKGARTRPLLRLSLEQGQGPNKNILHISGNGDFSDAPMGVRTVDIDLAPRMASVGCLWIVVERMDGGIPGDEVEVDVLSDGVVNVGPWGVGDG